MRNLLLGIAVGLFAGWLLFGGTRTRANRAPRSETPAPDTGIVERSARQTPSAPDTPREKVVDLAWIREANPRWLGVKAYQMRKGDVRVTPEALAYALEQVDVARTERDWSRFVGLIQILGATKTPEAQTKLVELMGDMTLLFHDWRVAEHFRFGLADARVDDVVAAARQRIEMEAERYTEKNRAAGWFEIIARHGSEADLSWLVELARDKRTELGEVLGAAAANPAAAQQLMRLWRAGSIRWGADGAARAFARNNPDEARQFFRAEFERLPPSGAKKVAHAYGYAVTEDSLAESKSFLLGVRDPAKRTAAADAVKAMQRNKLDISGLEPILLAPVEDAERLAIATDKERSEGYYRVLYGIQSNRLCWTERAADALDALAAAFDKGRGDGLRDVAKEIRAKLGTGDWVKSD